MPVDCDPVFQSSLKTGKRIAISYAVSKNDEFFYYKANKKHPGIYEIYRTNSQTGETTALTDLNGMTDFELSHDEQTLLLTHSKLTMPPELYVKTINSTNKVMMQQICL